MDDKWKYLIKKYPERAGIAYEIYMRDPTKKVNPVTYFNFAGKRIYQEQKRYKTSLKRYISKNLPDFDVEI
jgi:peptidyl-tRNA hydrolase